MTDIKRKHCVSSKEIILANGLQFKQLKRRSEKNLQLLQDTNLCLPDASWMPLPTEVTCGRKEDFRGFVFHMKETE